MASRGHHSDVGGITPGSMPSFSKSINDEGIWFKSFQLVKDDEFQEDSLKYELGDVKNKQPSRNIEDNICDLKAQVCSNNKGVTLLLNLVKEYGLKFVHGYMKYIQDAAEESVKEMLVALSEKNNMKEVDHVIETDYMDDGSPITVKLEIDRNSRTA